MRGQRQLLQHTECGGQGHLQAKNTNLRRHQCELDRRSFLPNRAAQLLYHATGQCFERGHTVHDDPSVSNQMEVCFFDEWSWEINVYSSKLNQNYNLFTLLAM